MKEIIEKKANDFFQKLGLEGEVSVAQDEENTFVVELTAQDPQMFIGEGGRVLGDIQYLLRLMLKKELKDPVRILLDINGYRKNKESYLRELARTTGDEVSLLKKTRELDPMPPSDRRIIHEELAGRNDVVSESTGEEPERRVVIRPKEAVERKPQSIDEILNL